MLVDILMKIARDDQPPMSEYRPRPSGWGRCIRASVYHALGFPPKLFPGRFVMLLEESGFTEEFTADWIRRSAWNLHSQQMPVNIATLPSRKGAPAWRCEVCSKAEGRDVWIDGDTIHGHIDGVLQDLLGVEYLWEMKGINHFGYERMEASLQDGSWDDNLVKWVHQDCMYLIGIGKLSKINRLIITVSNRNTSAKLEVVGTYNAATDTFTIDSALSTRVIEDTETGIRGDLRGGLEPMTLMNVAAGFLGYFNEVEEYVTRKELPRRPYELGDWHCSYCLAPSTPILMENFSWKRLSDIRPGDRVSAFDEHSGNGNRDRRMSVGVVEATRKVKVPALKISTDGGSVICSETHLWLAQKKSTGYSRTHKNVAWLRSSEIKPGDKIYKFLDPAGLAHHNPLTSEDEGYRIGYVQGLIDGEGTVRTKGGWHSIRVAMCDTEALDRYGKFLESFGITYSRGAFYSQAIRPMEKITVTGLQMNDLIEIVAHPLQGRECQSAGYLAAMFDGEGHLTAKKGAVQFRISNSDEGIINKTLEAAKILNIPLALEPQSPSNKKTNKIVRSMRLYTNGFTSNVVRFLSICQPAISRKYSEIYRGRLYNSYSIVKNISPAGRRELIDIQTDTRTFIAAGLASHNCQWQGTCWEGFEAEINKMLVGVDLPENLRDQVKVYIQFRDAEKEAAGQKDVTRSIIVNELQAQGIKKCKSPEGVSVTIRIEDRVSIDKELIPPAILKAAEKKTQSLKLDVRKAKKEK